MAEQQRPEGGVPRSTRVQIPVPESPLIPGVGVEAERVEYVDDRVRLVFQKEVLEE